MKNYSMLHLKIKRNIPFFSWYIQDYLRYGLLNCPRSVLMFLFTSFWSPMKVTIHFFFLVHTSMFSFPIILCSSLCNMPFSYLKLILQFITFMLTTVSYCLKLNLMKMCRQIGNANGLSLNWLSYSLPPVFISFPDL